MNNQRYPFLLLSTFFSVRFSMLFSVLLALPVLAQQTPALLNDYCVKCHNFEDWAGGLDIESINFEHVEEEPEIWEKILRKMRAGMMPPSDQKNPGSTVVSAFIKVLEQQLDASISPIPATPALHRLNRYEYGNAIRDLFGLNVDTATLLPQDDSSEGFDNIASSLNFSPALIQGYTSSAMKISRLAVGDMSAIESSVSYNAAADLRQNKHIDGLPLGTRGGLNITHHFPLDAEYDFSLKGGFGFGSRRNAIYSITLDGVSLEVDNPRDFRLAVSAGEHTLTAAFVDVLSATGVNDIYAEYNLPGAIRGIEIVGPFNATGPGNTSASRQSIFSCYPANNDEEVSCAEQIVSQVASRAFREPVTESDIRPIMAFYQQGYREGGFESGIEQALSRILIDPRFLFRFEESPVDLSPGEIYPIGDLELASRLSFFLWSSIPDAELIQLAMTGQLKQPEVLQQQTLRMLADPKSFALVENFSGQWLFLRELEKLTPETNRFNENLRQAFIQETQLLFTNIIAEDRPVTDFIGADYTFLNERLANHYGINDVRGSYFRKVALPEDSPRRGLLGQGSILTITSTASRTSPVIRGSWILENLLSAPVPDPPAGVETNLDGDGTTVLTSSIRERLEIHRNDPNCSSCHSVIDPVGFALENFDLIGAWREFDGDSAVDSSGVLVDGTPINGPADLRTALMNQPSLFVSTMTEKLLTYALGRGLSYYDMPLVRSILKDAEAEEYIFSALVLGIVNSEQFLKRIKEPLSATEPALTAAVQITPATNGGR